LTIANKIAKTIRGSSGGYQHCKAIGVMLEDRNIAQVSINMVNFEGTPLYRVFEAIRFEAERWGVPIIGSEIIGLTPAKALIDTAEYYLKIENFDYGKQVLENHLL
jgi:glutamate formiminotransferase